MMLRATAVLFVLTFGSTQVFAEPERKKLQVFEDIQQRVNRYSHFTIFDDVRVAIDEQGVVALTGHVTSPYKSREIAKRVARVDGVTGIDNAITALPVSRHDDQLRYGIAHAIYGNSNFWRYGAPPLTPDPHRRRAGPRHADRGGRQPGRPHPCGDPRATLASLFGDQPAPHKRGGAGRARTAELVCA